MRKDSVFILSKLMVCIDLKICEVGDFPLRHSTCHLPMRFVFSQWCLLHATDEQKETSQLFIMNLTFIRALSYFSLFWTSTLQLSAAMWLGGSSSVGNTGDQEPQLYSQVYCYNCLMQHLGRAELLRQGPSWRLGTPLTAHFDSRTSQ